jgi:hypothetical protein
MTTTDLFEAAPCRIVWSRRGDSVTRKVVPVRNEQPTERTRLEPKELDDAKAR